MYLRKTPQNNDLYLSIVEAVRKNGKPTQVTIESIGYLKELQKQYEDPIAHFQEKAKRMTLEKKHSSSLSVKIDLNQAMETSEDSFRNVGYLVFKRLYKELELDQFWKKHNSSKKITYSLDSIFQLLVYSRILYPASKKETYDKKQVYFEPFSFKQEEMYKALTLFSKHEKELQTWIFEHSKERYQRDLSYGYFDCTNYYFEIENNDEDILDEAGIVLKQNYRKRGPEKNHRPDPIIEMGLLMDSTGIPVCYDLFPGNESEKLHLRPIVNRAKAKLGIGRTIIVADRGLNTSDNMYYLSGKNDQEENHLDGYVYGQSIRGAEREFKEWVLKQDYIHDRITEDTETVAFTHKSRIYPKTIYITRETSNGKTKKQKITIDQKQMVYYSEKYAKKQANDRKQMVLRAQDLIAHPKKYDRVSSLGAAGYVLNLSFDQKTGEIIDKNLLLDEKRIQEEAKLDGYYSIVTSELKMSDEKMREVYRGLALIEDTFKVTKENLESRPVFVWTKESIEAHFMTCFTALVLVRLLELRTSHRYSVSKLIEAVQKYGCVSNQGNLYQFTYNSDIIRSFEAAFHLRLDLKFRTRQQIQHLLQY